MNVRRLLAQFVVVSAWLAMIPSAVAHRVDEYLQATRLSIDIDHVDLEIDLTAGVDLASEVFGWIDTNRDGEISNAEGEAYAHQMLRSIALKVDGSPVPIALAETSFPQFREMSLGVGTIRLRATAKVLAAGAGHHQVSFLNTHRPGSSVYLVNALVPANPRIQIADQRRDFAQHGLTLDFSVTADPLSPPARTFALLATLLMAGFLLLRCGYALTQVVAHRQRCWLFALPAFIGIVGLAPTRLSAQTSTTKNWTPRRTSDGKPDFEGNWATATLTPLERPPEFAAKEFLTEQEAAEYVKRTLEESNSDRRDGGAQTDLQRNYNEAWRDRGTTLVATRRTSLIVNPPDGKVPPLTPEAQKLPAAMTGGVGPEGLRFLPAALSAARPPRLPRSPQDLPLRVRCISRDLPMIPTPNNNFVQIIQSPGYVVILQEMMHEVRIIPLDRRPHLDSRIRGHMGDSRGRWEGNTLVIDTTNFIGLDNAYGADEAMHLTERLTRIDPDTILYQFTVDDPTAFTKPWSGEMSMRKTGEPVEEYACHEGNYAMESILTGARAEENSKAGGSGRPRQ